MAILFVTLSITGCLTNNAQKGAVGRAAAASALTGQIIGKNTTGTRIGT